MHANIANWLFAISILLVAAHCGGALFNQLRLPAVVGEILGGIALGPTLFGHFLPELHGVVFAPPGTSAMLSMLYWLGLLSLMFLAGTNFNPRVRREDVPVVAGLALGGLLITGPLFFAVVWGIDSQPFAGPKGNWLSLSLVLVCAATVTSIPVLTRIYTDLGVFRTRFGQLTILAATAKDIAIWAVLAVAIGLAEFEHASISEILTTALRNVVFFVVCYLLGPPLIAIHRRLPFRTLLQDNPIRLMILITLVVSGIASFLHVNPLFGAFLSGLWFGNTRSESFEKAKESFRSYSYSFLIPLYFVLVGMKIDLVASLDVVLLVAFAGMSTLLQAVGVLLPMALLRNGWTLNWHFTMAMNTRGAPGLVIASVALESGIVSEPLFVALALTAMITSCASGAWFRHFVSRGRFPTLDTSDLSPPR